ncbi:hypothetical protein ACFL0Y_01415 [Patescibacteria group bacterium]
MEACPPLLVKQHGWRSEVKGNPPAGGAVYWSETETLDERRQMCQKMNLNSGRYIEPYLIYFDLLTGLIEFVIVSLMLEIALFVTYFGKTLTR